ncbi:MAG: YbaK/EbsC family protein [Thermoplasmata archaeon]|nr:YbaK/EbsC family protein [Thermoplasmata archaeon]
MTARIGTVGTGEAAVRAHLHGLGVAFDVIIHPRAVTSIEEARAIGVEADEVLKTLVVVCANGPVLVVLPASRRLDMHAVREAVGDPHARLATEQELARDYAGFALGAIPPLGTLFDQPVVVDETVPEHRTVVFAAGTQTESVRVATESLFRAEDALVAPVSRAREDAS